MRTAQEFHLNWPQDADRLTELHSGDLVYLSGLIYTARDAAHRRLIDLLRQGQPLPLDLTNAAIFYAGPAPCPPGKICGSIGPTTSGRMDSYKEAMMRAGMRIMIGKGACDPAIAGLCRQYGAVYLAALGGVAALTAGRVRSLTTVAWSDLGAEALQRLEVRELPLVVVNDVYGQDFYAQAAASGAERS